MNTTADNTPAANTTGGENQPAPAPDANKPAPDANANKPADGNAPAPDANKPAPAADTPPDAATMKAYLVEKTADGKTALEGKTEAEIADLFKALKTKEASEADTKKDDKAGKDDKPKGEKPPVRAPEKYELKPGEGVKLTPDVQTKFEAIARELDLPQADAQKLLDLAPEINKAFASQLIETIGKTSEQWRADTKADKEIGGSGDKAILDGNMAIVAKARDAFASPDLLKLLAPFDAKDNPNGTGFGNHPEIIRLFLRLGKSISEDNRLVTGGNANSQLSPAQKLYSKTTPK